MFRDNAGVSRATNDTHLHTSCMCVIIAFDMVLIMTKYAFVVHKTVFDEKKNISKITTMNFLTNLEHTFIAYFI